MDQLPVEVYQYIFKYLEIVDLFDLRLVNKRFNNIVSEFSVKELIFQTGYKFRYNWAFSRRPINYLNVIPAAKQFVLRSGLFRCKGLRYLKISQFHKSRGMKLSHINSFVNLIQLEVDAGMYSSNDHLLNLPKLKVLSFSISYVSKKPGLLFDLPKLEMLDLDCTLHGVTFKYPQTIKQLKVQKCEPMMNVFRNVERFECFHLNNIDPTKQLDLFAIFPQMNELLIEEDRNNRLRQIIAEKASLEKHQVKIYYRSLECLDDEDLKRYRYKDYYLSNYTLDQHFKMYQRLADNLSFVEVMDFGILTRLFAATPIDFFDKYTNINKLFVRGRENQERFLSFIGRCTNLGFLSINDAHFDQSFYERLPAVAVILRELYIESADRAYGAQLNVDFVCRMKSLRIFNSNLELAPDEIQKVCGPQAGHLSEVGFALNRNLVHVERTIDDKYFLKNEGGLKLFNEEIDLNTLTVWLEFLKKEEKTTRSAFKKMRKV